MRAISALALAGCLSVVMITAAYANPSNSSVHRQQGVENSRKVMKHRFEQDKKMRAVKQQALAQKKTARSGN